MRLSFTKMQGQGNDFVMLNGIAQRLSLTPLQIQKLADRHFGIGCDQVLVVEPATQAGVDFRYRIYNADGGEVEQCGNGARCFARFVRDEGLTTQVVIRVETMSGIIAPRIEEDGRVTVDMGPPRLLPAEIPFVADHSALKYPLSLNGQEVTIGVVSMGNPHAVQLVDRVDTAPVSEMGPLIEHHEKFPSRVNAGFMQIVARDHIRLRVWERGAGETLACGTGACAAVVTGIRWGLLENTVRVSTRGGDLVVSWLGTEKAAVMMSGAATVVYHGEIDI
ncbi:MAG: diaminopimelate epimerase [Betaproteobacteria bacterium]|nr:diaminopimelate epimerase [Betaproteobacteria bacterium]